MCTIMSYVMLSFEKNMSLIKILRLQGDDISAPYDKSIVSEQFTHIIVISNNIF